MARQHEIIEQIMKPGNCVQILDGKEFGTLLGELLKMLTAAEEEDVRLRDTIASTQTDLEDVMMENKYLLKDLEGLKVALERRTPNGLKEKVL